MDDDKPIYNGFLFLPVIGKILIKKSWQQKFCLLFKSSKCGMERLEIYDSVDKGVPSKIITLENVIKIESKSVTHFTITTKISPYIYEFGAINSQLKNDWIEALQTVAFPCDVSSIRDNDLYCSSGEISFNIKIHSSPAAERCGLDNKNFDLILTSNSLQLKNTSSQTILYTWPYLFIRRYGRKHGKFFFEAGRLCDSGEGFFFIEHTNQQEILRCLESKMDTMKTMKQLKSAETTILTTTTTTTTAATTTGTTLLDCGDNQFHAALNMEARSRSPLPPSPTTSTTLYDIESNKSLIFKENDLKSVVNKSKPIKPPRKNLITKIDCNSSTTSLSSSSSTTTITTSINNNNIILSDYEPIDKYDKIEYRNDAWRTMGINDINHIEKNINNSDNDDEEYFCWGTQKNNQISQSSVKAPKIITQSNMSSDNYDKLNFFGSSSKLNLVKSGYKQVSLISSISNNGSNTGVTKNNDYDEVQPALEGVRLADDSYLGYAIIRKDHLNNNNNNNNNSASINNNEAVNHHFHNNEPYAVISKPKRV